MATLAQRRASFVHAGLYPVRPRLRIRLRLTLCVQAHVLGLALGSAECGRSCSPARWARLVLDRVAHVSVGNSESMKLVTQSKRKLLGHFHRKFQEV